VTDLGKQIVELHQQGMRTTEIAHRLNVAQSTVHYHLRKLREPEAPDPSKRRPNPAPNPRTRTLVGELLRRGMSRAEVARRLGVAKSTVSYHARQLGEEVDARFGKRIDWAVVQAYYDAGHSVRDCARVFGFSTCSWTDAAQRGVVTARPTFKPLEEVFATNTRRGRGHLKQRLLQAGLKDGSCERCGISEWLGQPLSVTLHHVNGDRFDNRVQNLKLLCPNCHSQTDNYAGRNGHDSAPNGNAR
jgi:transposase